ncbi:hypothetical protein GS448_12700 [Rhodococcus hoagii]|nr:hypothetical protein [Prescottella equi]MBM4692706.1 hypothetical protein [Prescottella equi]NKV89652.1 hypothetical protein [Prescottella equi]
MTICYAHAVGPTSDPAQDGESRGRSGTGTTPLVPDLRQQRTRLTPTPCIVLEVQCISSRCSSVRNALDRRCRVLLESNLAGCVPEWGFNVRKLMTRSVILGAATALALVGGGVADAAAPVSGAKYDFKNWDTCQLDKVYDPDTGVGTCMTVVIRDGTMRVGSLNVQIPDGSLMIAGGVAQDQVFVPAANDGKFGVYSKSLSVPGGALGTSSAEDFGPTAIQATVEAVALPVVDPYNLGVQLPVRLKLSNSLLGNNCYIGSTSNPIRLSLALQDAGAAQWISDTVPGVPGGVWPQATHKATNFAVPGATGCGLFGSLNWAVNQRAGLPSGGAGNSLSTTSSVYNAAGWELL